VPLEWAKTQNSLGIALSYLGSRTSQKEYLEKALIAYDFALTERTFERAPALWASTINNRASALLLLAEHDKIGTDQLKDAIASFQEALRGASVKTAPNMWAGIQANIGLAFLLFAERRSDRRALDEALLACRRALSEWTREKVPRLWAKVQVTIARVLTHRGELEDETDYLKEAEEALNRH
jgi:tetratricopeptide (TPR) repeat protein